VFSGASVTDTSGGGAKKDPHIAFPHGGRADFRGRNRVYYNFLSSPGFAVNVKTEESPWPPPRRSHNHRLSPPVCMHAQDATFKLHNSELTVDGSFITEAHFVVRRGYHPPKAQMADLGLMSVLSDKASFWAKELDEFNTGALVARSPCPSVSPTQEYVERRVPRTGWKVINGTCSGRYFKMGLGGYKYCGDLNIQMRRATVSPQLPLCPLHGWSGVRAGILARPSSTAMTGPWWCAATSCTIESAGRPTGSISPSSLSPGRRRGPYRMALWDSPSRRPLRATAKSTATRSRAASQPRPWRH